MGRCLCLRGPCEIGRCFAGADRRRRRFRARDSNGAVLQLIGDPVVKTGPLLSRLRLVLATSAASANGFPWPGRQRFR